MEKDIKDAVKKLEAKRKKIEKTEKIILFLSGIILIVIFSIIGLNIYSGMGQKVSEPEIEVVSGKKLEPEKEILIEDNLAKEEHKEKIQIEANLKDKSVKEVEGKEDIKKPQEKPVQQKISAEKKPLQKQTKEEEKITSFYTIQVGAFKTKSNAQKFINKNKLENAFIYYDNSLYKVMVGKFKTKKEAFKYLRENSIKGFVRKIKAQKGG